MATTIPCTVDTRPMANEIHSVSNHVKGTTAAVVTMHTAVIAAEKRGTEKVCNNVNRGFFTMVRSQISQKIAKHQSRVEALLMKLGQQKRSLDGIRSNMEREYGRIAARYLRLFTSINKELETRISQIDRPVFDLVNKHMAASSNRMNALSAWASTMQSEGSVQSQRILVSNMKYDAQQALDRSRDFLAHIGEQRVLTDSVLISNPAGNDDRLYSIPVAVCVSVADPSGYASTRIVCPDGLSDSERTRLESAVRDSELPWRSAPAKHVASEFERLLGSSKVPERVRNQMRRLYDSSKFQTL